MHNWIYSREKALKQKAWNHLQDCFTDNKVVTGVPYNRVKGGMSVDLDGVTAFLPGSQVDIRPIKDLNTIMGGPQAFLILKMDRKRGNIVVSRRAVLEESRAEARTELVSNLGEGQVLNGIVKNITDYGAFVDLGACDGLIHLTDISWKRISHPSEVLSVGKKIKVKLIKYNSDSQRLSLGMKQLNEDPWKGADDKFKVCNTIKDLSKSYHNLVRKKSAA